jgi:lactate permease
MAFILAFSPIVLILILMVGLKWSAARAGAAGYLWVLFIAIVFFGANTTLLAYAHTKALLLTIDVLLIVWTAFFLYRVTDEAGAIKTIGEALPHLTNDRGMQALIIGWVFATFLQGVGGFGVPVAVTAPMLVGLGFSPLAAVVSGSVGHAWGVTFGSMGSSFQALIATTNLPDFMLAPFSALFLGIAGMTCGFMVAYICGGWNSIKRLYGVILAIGLVMGAAHYLVAITRLWNIASFVAGIAGLVIVFPLARRFRGDQSNNGVLNWKALFIALSGYLVLILVILVVQVFPPIKQFLGKVVLSVNFPEISTSTGLLGNAPFVSPAGVGRNIVLFRHTGMVLLYSSILAYLIYRWAGCYSQGSAQRIIKGTLSSVLSSSVSITSMVTMAVIMENAGMTDILARGMASGVGALFPVISPWIGALGAFITGSNTNSNVVFAGLQMQTALLLKLNVAIILAGQTAGGALASAIAPTKIIVGASTAGMAGREGEVMRSLAPYIGLLIIIISILTVLGVWLVI